MKTYLYIIITFLLLFTCCREKKETIVTPWGETINTDQDSISSDDNFSYNDIVNNGEIIILTLSGPDSYYDYHGKGLGTDYLLAEKFAQKIGVSVRVNVCKDTTDLIKKLMNNEGDIIAFELPKKKLPRTETSKLDFCGVGSDSLHTQWAVKKGNSELADSLNCWFTPNLIAQVRQEENYLLSSRSIQRHVYSPMLNKSKGIISKYDRYFQMFAPAARMDWRLMAAQCYQESCFDPNARSWAGALGLMQIMPSTANHLGLPMSEIHNPEANIAAAAQYMQELGGYFADIPNSSQRIYYVLASYNGGYYHVRDAMALCRKYGRDPYSWGNVADFILKLRIPQYYNDPVVKHGYMRGDETVDYVDRIRARWMQYCGVASGGTVNGFGSSPLSKVPHRARHRNRYRI